MAINKTIFTADRTAQKEEIFNWLKANAEDYFDEISQNADGNIVCSLKNGASFSFIFDTTTSTTNIYTIKSKTGNTKNVAAGNASLAYTKAGIVTSNGLMLISPASLNSGSESYNVTVISKTNQSSICVVSYSKNSSGSSGLYHYFIDLNSDTDWIGTTQNILTYSVPVTSLAPVCFASGNYCEHVFMTIFSQFVNSPCIMQINGKKYAYGGYLALEE